MSTPRRSATLAVRVSTRVLPAGQVRERYRLELTAELHDLGHSQQLHYAAGVVSSAWSLRRAVTEEKHMGSDLASTPRSPLHCRLHLYHHHRITSTEDGVIYMACRNCGHVKDNYPDPENPSLSSRGIAPMG